MADSDKPIVSLHNPVTGDSVRLSNRAADMVLMQGATGLGMAPWELTTAPLPGGGSVLQHRRQTEAELVIPFLNGAATELARFEQRRELEAICDGLTEVRITQPWSGDYRSQFGYVTDGLQGDYGAGEDSLDGQKIVLTLTCLNPLWQGTARHVTHRTNAPANPFISVPSVTLMDLWGDPVGDAPQGPWQAIDGAIEAEGTGQLSGAVFTGRMMPAGERQAVTVSARVEFLPDDAAGAATIYAVSYAAGRQIGDRQPVIQTNLNGFWGKTFYTEPGADSFALGFFTEASMERGQRVLFSDVKAETADVDAGAPALERVAPFFPIILGESAVNQRITITIEGDAPVWPKWTITGPGEDVLLESGRGERLFIPGRIDTPITVITEPMRQTIRDESSQIWDRVPVGKDDLFPLRPGRNKVTVSMVNATAASKIEMDYAEQWKAGW